MTETTDSSKPITELPVRERISKLEIPMLRGTLLQRYDLGAEMVQMQFPSPSGLWEVMEDLAHQGIGFTCTPDPLPPEYSEETRTKADPFLPVMLVINIEDPERIDVLAKKIIT